MIFDTGIGLSDLKLVYSVDFKALESREVTTGMSLSNMWQAQISYKIEEDGFTLMNMLDFCSSLNLNIYNRQRNFLSIIIVFFLSYEE